MIKFIVLFCLIGFVVSQETCDELAEGADKCAKEVIYNFLTEDLPNNLEEVTLKCAWAKENLLCAKKYKNQCVKKLPGTMFNILLRNGIKLVKKTCKDEEKKTEFLARLECLKGDNKPDIVEVIKKYQVFQLFISNIEDEDNLLPAFCCGLDHLTQHINSQFELCRDKVGEESVTYFKEEFARNTKEIGDLFCLKFDVNEYCPGRYKELFEQIKEAVKTPVNYNLTSNRFLTPLIAMATRMTAA